MHKAYEKDKCAYMFRVNKNKMIIQLRCYCACARRLPGKQEMLLLFQTSISTGLYDL